MKNKNNNTLNNKKLGFTLAETLITLAIIGVVAAFTIPAMKSLAPNKNKIMLRKAYYTIEQIIEKMINDNVNYPTNRTVKVGGYTYLQGFNYTTQTTNTSNKFCYFFTDNLNTIGNITCPAIGTATAHPPAFVVNTTDGISWFLGGFKMSEQLAFPVNPLLYWTVIYVDVNGADNSPNCLDDTGILTINYLPNYPSHPYTDGCSNPDTFIFGIRFDGKIQIGSGPGNDPYMESVLLAPTKNQQ